MPIFYFWINSCLHVALCAGALTLGSSYWVGADEPFALAILAFFGTWSVYLAQRIFKGKGAGLTEVHQHILLHKKGYILVATLSGLIAAGLTSILGLPYVVMGGLGFILAVVYIYLPGSKKNLRNSPWAKIALVAGVWTLITLGLPLANAGNWDTNHGWLMVERFAFITLITIPFDIRDMLRDAPKQKNLPILLGLAKTRLLMVAMLVICIVAITTQFLGGNISSTPYYAVCSAYLCIAAFAIPAKTTLKEVYFTFGIESTSLVLGLLLCYFEGFS